MAATRRPARARRRRRYRSLRRRAGVQPTCGRRISDVRERPDPSAVADDRQLPPSNRIEERAAPAERCCWTVEPAVAQRGRLSMLCGLKCGFQVANRVQRPAKCRRRIGIQWIILRLDGSASPLVGPTRKALRDDSPHAGRTGGREKVVGAFGSQPVRQGELAVEPSKVQVRGIAVNWCTIASGRARMTALTVACRSRASRISACTP